MNSRKHPMKVVRRDPILVAVWGSTGGVEPGPEELVVSTWRLGPEEADWRRTDSFKTDDLPLLAEALLEAHAWIRNAGRASDNRRSAHAS